MPPPEKIFVYEIEGKVNPPAGLTEADFLGCWREGDYTYLFFSRQMEAQVQAWVTVPGRGRYSSETVLNYADWEAGQAFKPAGIAGFHLCPIWETPHPAPGEIVLKMEPGLAFGSGHHPTSRLCLQLLRQVYDRDTPREVLDLGTGTGILALAAMALGARRVVAVDYNDLAARAAARNVRHNRREVEILLIQGEARDFAHLPADLSLANIHLDVLLDLLTIPEFLRHQRHIFSGIRGTQIEKFKEALKASPLEVVEILDENLWFAVLTENGGYANE